MTILFCSDYLTPRCPDSAYEAEAAAAEAAGLNLALFSYEALVDERDAAKAIRRVGEASPAETAVYRGWMLTPERYGALYEALAERGMRLINDPTAYRHAHHLPESYDVIRDWTPHTAWLRADADVSMEQVSAALAPFGDAPVIVKDFVKSRKHEWEQACFIPSAADAPAVERVVRCFLDRQGADLAEGLVFREFVRFEPLTLHPKSGMPLTKEYRLFFLDGERLCTLPYWEEADYDQERPPEDLFADVARNVRSRFFTMDVAKRIDGDWMIVELGDGQVAGLPDTADLPAFYQTLRDRLP